MQKNHIPLSAPKITFTNVEGKDPKVTLSLAKYPNVTILRCLQRALDLEEYEEAAIYRDELLRREVNPKF